MKVYLCESNNSSIETIITMDSVGTNLRKGVLA